jgi:hypothetical protein
MTAKPPTSPERRACNGERPEIEGNGPIKASSQHCRKP